MSDGWTAFGIIVLLFALIGLMPKFDGRRDHHWREPEEGENDDGLE